VLKNIQNPTTVGHFHDKQENATKPLIVEDYSHHMGYEDEDRTTNRYSIGHCTWKWTKKLFFHLLET
jgi:hypothetical protein